VDISLNFDNGDGFDMGDVTDNSSVAMETDAPVAKETPEPQAETAASKPVCALQVPYATYLRLGWTKIVGKKFLRLFHIN
jgi:hypothetical protein